MRGRLDGLRRAAEEGGRVSLRWRLAEQATAGAAQHSEAVGELVGIGDGVVVLRLRDGAPLRVPLGSVVASRHVPHPPPTSRPPHPEPPADDPPGRIGHNGQGGHDEEST